VEGHRETLSLCENESECRVANHLDMRLGGDPRVRPV
jgi:hypothetical protein